jgi:hypothetical protein
MIQGARPLHDLGFHIRRVLRHCRGAKAVCERVGPLKSRGMIRKEFAANRYSIGHGTRNRPQSFLEQNSER